MYVYNTDEKAVTLNEEALRKEKKDTLVKLVMLMADDLTDTNELRKEVVDLNIKLFNLQSQKPKRSFLRGMLSRG